MTDHDETSGEGQGSDSTPQPPPPVVAAEDGVPDKGQGAGASDNPTGKKRGPLLDFWRELKPGDRVNAFVATGTLFVAVAALLNTCADKSMEHAIGRLADIVSAQQDEVNGISNETNSLDRDVAQARREADAATSEAQDTNALIGPAITNAKAAVKSLDVQQRDFLADERPRVALLEYTPNAHNRPEIDNQTGNIIWNFAYENYGKSTATDIRLVKYLGVGIESAIDDGQRVSRAELVHDKSTWTTIFYTGTLDRDVASDIVTKRTQPVIMAAVFSYRDEAGILYYGNICQIASRNGSLQICILRDDFIAQAKGVLAGLESVERPQRKRQRQ